MILLVYWRDWRNLTPGPLSRGEGSHGGAIAYSLMQTSGSPLRGREAGGEVPASGDYSHSTPTCFDSTRRDWLSH